MCLKELSWKIKVYADQNIKPQNYLIFSFLGLIISLLRHEYFSFLNLTVSRFSSHSSWFQNKVAHYWSSIPFCQHCPYIFGDQDIKENCHFLKLTLTTQHIRKALISSKPCPVWCVWVSIQQHFIKSSSRSLFIFQWKEEKRERKKKSLWGGNLRNVLCLLGFEHICL